jgi:hypothetical protein
MAFIRTLKKGAAAAVSSYKLLIMVWLTSLLMIIIVAMPLKSALKNIFGNSLAVERLTGGFDAGLNGDMGDAFKQLLSSATTGGLLLVVAGFLLYTFFAGGLFTRFTTAYGEIKVSSFMKASAYNFIPFLKVSLLICLIIAAYTLIIVGVPALIIVTSAAGSMPNAHFMIIFYIIWVLGMPVWLLTADYSRRWIAATGSKKVFRALRQAFKILQRRFWFSFSVMVVIVMLNILFVVVSFWFAGWSVPERSLTIFLFFIVTQMLFIIRLFMKAWRYATVCELALLPGR